MKIMPRLEANIVVRGDYGVLSSNSHQHIKFEDKCPKCGESGLKIVRNRYCSDGEWYNTDNIVCKNNCRFMYIDLINLEGYKEVK